MTTLDSAEDFRIGRVVSRLFNALFANLPIFLPLAALLTIPNLLLNLYTTSHPGSTGLNPAGGFAPGGGLAFFRLVVLQSLIYIVFSYILQAALVQGTVTYLNDEKPSFGQSLSNALKSIVPLIVIAILGGLAMMLGLVLLVVPGIILALMWTVVVPVRVVENTGIAETFGRSRALTKGHRGKIFLLFLMYVVLAVVVSFATRPLFGVSMLARSLTDFSALYIVVDWAERVFLAALTAVGAASIYYELRLVKEGAGPEDMATVLD